MVNSWSADDGQIFLSGTYFSSVVGSDFTGLVTEISVDGGERDADSVRCMGSGTNHYMYRKGQTLFEGSIKFHTVNGFPMLALQGGSYASGAPLEITGDGITYPVTATYVFTDKYDASGAQWKHKFDNIQVTSFPWSIAVDGTAEAELNFKCLPHNYSMGFTANRLASPLTI